MVHSGRPYLGIASLHEVTPQVADELGLGVQSGMLIGAVFAAIWFYSQFVLFVMALAYMLSGVLLRLMYALRRRPAGSAPPPIPQTQE